MSSRASDEVARGTSEQRLEGTAALSKAGVGLRAVGRVGRKWMLSMVIPGSLRREAESWPHALQCEVMCFFRAL